MRNALAKLRYRARTGDAGGVLHSIRVAPSERVLPPGAAAPRKGPLPCHSAIDWKPVDGYVTKPFDMDRVVSAVRDVLGLQLRPLHTG
jgi:hypothetical protein